MKCAKISISLDKRTLRGLDALIKLAGFRSRSEAIQNVLQDKIAAVDSSRLARECAKLSPAEHQAMAEEGMAHDAESWPAYQGATSSGLILTQRKATSSPAAALSSS